LTFGDRVRVIVGFPLETELVERIRACPFIDELIFEPDLLPRPRYPNDHAGAPLVLEAAANERWHALLRRADVLFGYPGETSASLAQALEVGQGIRFVQGTSAGMGAHVQRARLGAAILERVLFASAAGVHAGMLAEFVFYGMLTLRKDAQRLARLRRDRCWEHYVMGELEGSEIAVVGMGQIGCAVSSRARAFGMRVVAVTRMGEPHPLADETHATSEIGSVMRRCDAVVLTLPLTDRTRYLVDAAAIGGMRPDAIFVNVGRGAIADSSALLEALAKGRIAGAVLDVFDPEPLPSDHPFWDMQNVIMSPHTAALSVHENRRIVEIFCENVERLVAGRPLRNAINLIEFY